ncbi:hypothetical protein KZB12_24245, partial [Escherichia coli]|nr:hypothetical protein [Escherichia coli]
PPTVSHIRPDFPEPYESPSDGLRGKNEYFSHPVYLFLREFSLQDSRGGSGYDFYLSEHYQMERTGWIRK